MTSLFRVTVVAETDRPVAESTIRDLSQRLSEQLAQSGPGEASVDEETGVVVREDRHGYTLVLLVEAESSDDAVRDVERAASEAMGGRHETDDGTRLEQVRAEPAYAP
jgi:hypothetical protein